MDVGFWLMQWGILLFCGVLFGRPGMFGAAIGTVGLYLLAR